MRLTLFIAGDVLPAPGGEIFEFFPVRHGGGLAVRPAGGQCGWFVNTNFPMDGKIKKILTIIVVICVVVWLVYAFGILDRSSEIRVSRVD